MERLPGILMWKRAQSPWRQCGSPDWPGWDGTPAPVINGVADQTVEAGSEFDALAGVTVWTEGSLTPVERQDTANTMTMFLPTPPATGGR